MFDLLPTITEANYQDFLEYEADMVVRGSEMFLKQLGEGNRSLRDAVEASIQMVVADVSGDARAQATQKSRAAVMVVLRLLERELQFKAEMERPEG